MNPNDYTEEQWFPELPDGYVQQPGSQEDWNATAMHVNPHQASMNVNPHQTAVNNWNQPSQPGWNPWQNSSRHPQQGWPGWSNQPGFPGQSGWPWQGGWNPGQPSHPGSGGGSGGGGQQQGPPTSAPPSQTPQYPEQSMLRVDPGGIRGCMYRFTYVWTSRRHGFWFFPTFVGRTSVAGYQWSDQWRRWVYTGIDLDRIDQFTCF